MGIHPPAGAHADASPSSPETEGATSDALDRLFLLVQDDLRRIAHRKLDAEATGHTLSTTALVHEAYLRLASQQRVQWSDRGQLLALAALTIRRILIDHARRHKQIRERVRYDSADAAAGTDGDQKAVQLAAAQRSDELLALDEALERLAAVDERLSRVVECRFFAGYSEGETAEALGVTSRTVARDWVKAKHWLYEELRDKRRDE